MKILAIPGSLRRDSFNRRLLVAAAKLVPKEADVVIFDALKLLPPFDEDDEPSERVPAQVRELRAAIADADAVLFSTPEYNSSIPGQLKNAVDWASRPKASAALLGKPVAVIGASAGAFGAVWAQAELRKVLGAAGARVVEGEVAVGHAQERFNEDGELNDDSLGRDLRDVLKALLA